MEVPRAHNTTTTRPRAVVPIVPVIPRSLQTKRKFQPVLKPLTINDSSKRVASSSKEAIEHGSGASPVLEGPASETRVNGNLEAQKDVHASATASSVQHGTPKSLEIPTDRRSFTIHLSLHHAELFVDVYTFF